MQHTQLGDTYIIKIEKGEEAMTQLTEFCRSKRIAAGTVHGIGAAEFVRCGYYNLTEKDYHFTEVEELVEVVSFSGNIALKDNEPFIHAHGVFARDDTTTFGGHVDELRVGVTLEVVLQQWSTTLHREYDEAIGLHLLQLTDSDN